ncbi:MAG: hypothetical protein VB049_04030 [Candidatus Pelethousia sp.]|nr:hypothetical protein [Candidatus Pelethousia sp.]
MAVGKRMDGRIDRTLLWRLSRYGSVQNCCSHFLAKSTLGHLLFHCSSGWCSEV